MARKIQKSTPQTTGPAPLLPCTALYIRVSTDKQADEGYSLDAQESRLRSFCDAQGWEVCPGHVYVDAGLSGKSTERPAFQKMLQAAQDKRIVRVVAIKLDRMARNTREFLATVDQLDKFDCALVLLKESFDTSTPHGRFALTMFAAIAELESSQITERVMSGKREKAAQGGDNGRCCPLGYSFADGRYSVEESAAQTVRSIFTDFTTGQSLTEIARRLAAQDAPTARGGKWYPATVRYILTNGFYAGIAQYEQTETVALHPAIIDAGTYSAAVARLEKM